MTARVAEPTRPAQFEAGVLDRLLSWRISLRWEVVAYALIFAIAFGLRFWDLGARSLHHDESIHAQWSWGLLQGNYKHDPVFHGPLYYHVQGLVFFIFGVSDYTARVSAAVFGSMLVALPLFLRRWLGAAGTLAAVALIAFSPTLVYYSRFFREDIYMAFFTMVMVAAMWRYFASGRDRWLIIFALAFAGSMATKEATYLTVAVLLIFVDFYLAAELARQTLSARDINVTWRRFVLTVALAPWAWALAAAWPLLGGLRRSLEWDRLPRQGDVLVLLGTITVPMLTPILRGPLESLGVVDEKQLVCRCFFDKETRAVTCRPEHPGRDVMALGGLFLVTTSLSALVGLAWRPRTWAIAVGAGALLYLTLMTSLWTNFEGLCTGPWGSLDYWLSQQDEKRGNQPWFYYYMLMPAYEFLPLAIAIGGVWWSTVRGDAFSRFLWLWMLGTWVALSMSGEKMPWLNTHIALPAALLAAWTIGRAWRSWDAPREGGRTAVVLVSIAAVAASAMALAVFLPGGATFVVLRLFALGIGAATVVAIASRLGGRSAGVVAVTAVVAALAFFSLRTMIGVVYERGDVPKDLLIYTQSSPDIPRLADDIDKLAQATGLGHDLPIAVDSTDSFAWPWAWYLRDYKAVVYTDMSNGPPSGNYPVLLVARQNVARITNNAQSGTQYGPPIPYPHRWWFDETYRAAIPEGPWSDVHKAGPFEIPSFNPNSNTLSHLRDGIFKGEWLDTWFDYFRDHDPGRPPGSVDAMAFFPANFDRERGLLAARAVEVPKPTTDNAGRPTFGSFGTFPGQFLQPADVEADAQGNLYVIDPLRKELQKFDASGNFLAAVDIRVKQGDAAEQAEPWGLAVASDGTIYVADTFGWRVRVFDKDLKSIGGWGQAGDPTKPPGPFDLYGPRDIAVDPQGNVWVTDTGNNRLMVYSPGGEFVRSIGERGTAPGQFSEPVGLAITPDGAVFVADAWNRRVQILDLAGRPVSDFPVNGWGGFETFDKPYLEPLAGGNLAVSVPALNQVRIYGRGGNVLATVAPTEDPLVRPYGILETADGKLWISEGGSGRLRLFAPQ